MVKFRRVGDGKRVVVDESVLSGICNDLLESGKGITTKKRKITSNAAKVNKQKENNSETLDSSRIEDDPFTLDESTIARYKAWKEANPSKSHTVKLRRKAALNTLKLLQAPDKKPKRSGRICASKSSIANGQSELVNWDSATYIVNSIRKCVLRREWHHLNGLLLALMKCTKDYKNYVKEISYLNFLINKDCRNGEVLRDFMQLCFVATASRDVKSMEVWFRDI